MPGNFNLYSFPPEDVPTPPGQVSKKLPRIMPEFNNLISTFNNFIE
jgi:hypothetical protein